MFGYIAMKNRSTLVGQYDENMRRRKVAVGTVKKSIETRSGR
jgi:hypothetical protein